MSTSESPDPSLPDDLHSFPPVAEGPSFEERFATLEASNNSLANDIRALTATLQIVNELQIEQKAQARRQLEAETMAAVDKKATEVRLDGQRRAINVAAIAVAILLPLVSLVVYLFLLNHVNDLLDRNSSDRQAACEARNAGTQADVRREQLLADISDDPAERKIHQDSSDEIAESLIDCASLYKK